MSVVEKWEGMLSGIRTEARDFAQTEKLRLKIWRTMRTSRYKCDKVYQTWRILALKWQTENSQLGTKKFLPICHKNEFYSRSEN